MISVLLKKTVEGMNYFEDESLKPALVRHQNVRIIFELPGIIGGDEIDESYDDVD